MPQFGKWLRENRKAHGLTQGELGRKAGISTSYVSALERCEPHHLTNAPPQPAADVVERIAKALAADLDEARLIAGYAPTVPPRSGPPQTLEELVEIAESLGIQNLHFYDQDKMREATPEQLQEVLDAIEIAMNVTLSRQMSAHNHEERTDLRIN